MPTPKNARRSRRLRSRLTTTLKNNLTQQEIPSRSSQQKTKEAKTRKNILPGYKFPCEEAHQGRRRSLKGLGVAKLDIDAEAVEKEENQLK